MFSYLIKPTEHVDDGDRADERRLFRVDGLELHAAGEARGRRRERVLRRRRERPRRRRLGRHALEVARPREPLVRVVPVVGTVEGAHLQQTEGR